MTNEKFLSDFDFKEKYGYVKVVFDSNKKLLQFIHKGKRYAPIYMHSDIESELYILGKGKGFEVRANLSLGNAVIVAFPEYEITTLQLVKENIDYIRNEQEGLINMQLAEYTILQDKIVKSIITYFYQISVKFNSPYVITDTSGLCPDSFAISEIKNGKATIVNIDGKEIDSCCIEDIFDDELIELYNWERCIKDKLTI